jgi:fatty-acid desaturase
MIVAMQMVITLMLLFPQPCLKIMILLTILITLFLDYQIVMLTLWLVDDGSEPIYETIHFFDISYSFEHISGSTNHQCENAFEPTALVAQKS